MCYTARLILSLQRDSELFEGSSTSLEPWLYLFWCPPLVLLGPLSPAGPLTVWPGLVEGLKNGGALVETELLCLLSSSPQHRGVSSPPSSTGLVTSLRQDETVKTSPWGMEKVTRKSNLSLPEKKQGQLAEIWGDVDKAQTLDELKHHFNLILEI